MGQRKFFKCDVCGYIHEGDEPPEACPVCGAPKEMFSLFVPAAATDTTSTTTATATATITKARGRDEHIVVVGAGIAGLTAAESARRTSDKVQITLIARPAEGLPYYRLNLTRYLSGEIDTQALPIRDESWYRDERITVRHGEVSRIDREKKSITLGGTETLAYDRLVLATGANSFVPPIPGAAEEGVLTLRTTSDARALLAAAEPGRQAVVVGGGLLGIEAAAGLMRHGLTVTVVEKADRLLSRQLAPLAARLLQKRLEAMGLTFFLEAGVEAIGIEGRKKAVRLTQGPTLPADVVLIAAGVRPEVELAQRAGLAIQKGIVVDDSLLTSDPAIYAAGDAAEHRSVLYGIWPAAYAQGLVAGANAAGDAQRFAPLAPSNRLKVVDANVLSVGDFGAVGADVRVVERERAGTALRLVMRGDQLVGANLYGDTGLDNVVSEAIAKATPFAEALSSLAALT